MESRLFQALKAFKGADGCEANLFKEFKKIAEEAFFSGYFLVNGGCKDAYKLKLTCIEFYYHEDDGNTKDEKKYLKGKDEFGYALGAVCPNPSGYFHAISSSVINSVPKPRASPTACP